MTGMLVASDSILGMIWPLEETKLKQHYSIGYIGISFYTTLSNTFMGKIGSLSRTPCATEIFNFTPKQDDKHPCHFNMELPSGPRNVNLYIVSTRPHIDLVTALSAYVIQLDYGCVFVTPIY